MKGSLQFKKASEMKVKILRNTVGDKKQLRKEEVHILPKDVARFLIALHKAIEHKEPELEEVIEDTEPTDIYPPPVAIEQFPKRRSKTK